MIGLLILFNSFYLTNVGVPIEWQKRKQLTEVRLTGLVSVFDLPCTETPYTRCKNMDAVSVNKFRDNLKTLVEQVIINHEPLKVTRRAGDDFVVISADDWEREQESLYVLQNTDLMQQIAKSVGTHSLDAGYQPTEEQLNEITGI